MTRGETARLADDHCTSLRWTHGTCELNGSQGRISQAAIHPVLPPVVRTLSHTRSDASRRLPVTLTGVPFAIVPRDGLDPRGADRSATGAVVLATPVNSSNQAAT